MSQVLQAAYADNIWRHWWAGHMKAVGAISRLSLEPIVLRPDTARVPSATILPRERTTAKARRSSARRAVPPNKDDPSISFYDLGDILNQLDEYWPWLRALQRYYPVGYSLGARIGAVMSPVSENFADDLRARVIPKDVNEWPAFMMESMPSTRDVILDGEHRMLPRLTVFHKAQQIGDAVHSGIAMYECVLFYFFDSNNRKERRRHIPAPVRFPIGVGYDGAILPLRISQTRFQSDIAVHHKYVGYPRLLKELYEDNKKLHKMSETLQEWCSEVFYRILTRAYLSDKGFHVTVKKDNLRARFSVAHYATAQFFRDRDFTATVDGRQARIFHVVREHERVLSNGKTTVVPQHYAGAQTFTWHGYDVKITVSGHHHTSVNDFTLASVDEVWASGIDDKVDMDRMWNFLGENAWNAPKISIHQSEIAKRQELARTREFIDEL